jgi:hypothetical protein
MSIFLESLIIVLAVLNSAGVLYLLSHDRIFQRFFEESVYKASIDSFKFFLYALIFYLLYLSFELAEIEVLSNLTMLISLIFVLYGVVTVKVKMGAKS